MASAPPVSGGIAAETPPDVILRQVTPAEFGRLVGMAVAATSADGGYLVLAAGGGASIHDRVGDVLRDVPDEALAALFGSPTGTTVVFDLQAHAVTLGSVAACPFPAPPGTAVAGGVVVVHRAPRRIDATTLPHLESLCRGVLLTATLRHTTAALANAVAERDGALRDLRRRAHDATHTSETRLRLAVEAAGIGFWDWNPRTNEVFYSPEWKAMLGYADDELPDTFGEFEARVHPDDLARIMDRVRQHLASPDGAYSAEFRLRHRDGTYRWIFTRAAVQRDEHGTPVRMLGSHVDISSQKRIQVELEASREALRRLSGAQLRAREEERARIAREIHDDLGQSLASLRLEVARLQWRLAAGASDGQAELTGIDHAIQDMTARVRRIASDLRPGMLDDLGLTAALEWQTQDFEARTGIECRTSIRLSGDPPEAVATALFRIVQESLTNVSRHARAGSVVVRLTDDGGEWRLHVVDDGVGMASPDTAGLASHGLAGMRERARLLGGDLMVDSTPGQGTMIRVRVPRPPTDQS